MCKKKGLRVRAGVMDWTMVWCLGSEVVPRFWSYQRVLPCVVLTFIHSGRKNVYCVLSQSTCTLLLCCAVCCEGWVLILVGCGSAVASRFFVGCLLYFLPWGGFLFLFFVVCVRTCLQRAAAATAPQMKCLFGVLDPVELGGYFIRCSFLKETPRCSISAAAVDGTINRSIQA